VIKEKEFINYTIKSLLVLFFGVQHKFTVAYHPQSNGLVERRNQDIGKLLKKYKNGNYSNWNDWIPIYSIMFKY